MDSSAILSQQILMPAGLFPISLRTGPLQWPTLCVVLVSSGKDCPNTAERMHTWQGDSAALAFRAQKTPLSPEIQEKTTEELRNPLPPHLQNIQKKKRYENPPKMTNLFLSLSLLFFHIFGGSDPGSGIRNFSVFLSVFPGLRGFLISTCQDRGITTEGKEMSFEATLSDPFVCPYPKIPQNLDHGLSFPPPETQTMV